MAKRDMPTNSGVAWVAKFPTSTKISDLKSPFRESFEAFCFAMKAAGIKVTVTASRRPKQRAYLMHYSWLIVKGKIDPAEVPPIPEVEIVWNHAHAVQAAKEMVEAYGTGGSSVAPALTSRHIEGRAIDTVLSWSKDLTIKNKDGSLRPIKGAPRNASHPELIAAGATYGVIHFKPPAADKVHWSDDGH